MFSSRLHSDLSPNAIARLIERKRTSGETLLDLTGSNPARAGIVFPEDEILGALAERSVLGYDPHPAGSLAAREAVARYYSDGGIAVPPDRILLAASTSEAYSFLFKLLCDPGDEVLVPRPSYPLFEYLASMESVRVKQYPLLYDGAWSVDLDALEGCIGGRTRAVAVVNPNNPTGSFLKTQELDRLDEVCSARSIAFLSDEVFADYAFRADARRACPLRGARNALTFVMSGLSKVAALPQIKLGWICVAGPTSLAMRAYERLEWIADTYLSVSASAQCGADRLLELRTSIQRQIKTRTSNNLAAIRSALPADSPLRLLDAEGGWSAILEIPRTRSEEEWIAALIEEDNVVTQPGYFYDFEREGYIVLSLLTLEDVFREGLRRLVQRIA